jgi:hypothetical protein
MPSSRSWPFDDDDRPSGSVRPLSQADLQAILDHLTSEDPDQLLAGSDANRPVVAVRVRASVGQAGGSAQARWRRARAAEWAAWVRTLPWRAAATLGIGAAGGVLGSMLVPRLSLVLGALAAMAAGWALRFRLTPDAVAWRRGRRGSDAPPASWLRWSGTGGRSCTTWPSLAAGPTSIAMIPGAAVAARSDPNTDRPGALRVGIGIAGVLVSAQGWRGRPGSALVLVAGERATRWGPGLAGWRFAAHW